ncbi:MAG: hypothetical protein GKR89_29305 [Candidatus Latescibacteria bacterium]|nr:hypothetical protein [Candidatus Latescibacterota bacterium]
MPNIKYSIALLLFAVAATALPLTDSTPQLQRTDANAVWSPDSSQIAFDSWRDGDGEIYTAPADGNTPVRLTHQPGYDWAPVWSPDGSRIAFISQRDGNDEIYVMQADGSRPMRLTHRPGRDWQPAWSPNGAHIAFMGQDKHNNWDIFVVASDGSWATTVQLTHHSGRDGLPVWSPDGSRIAFVSQRDGDFEIYVMQADGSNPMRLTHRAGIDAYPSWSADGTEIIFTAMEQDGPEYISIPAGISKAANQAAPRAHYAELYDGQR